MPKPNERGETMERIGKVFKLGVRDVGECRIVDGYVRGKKLANIVRSIDNLECVSDKLRNDENAEAAIKCYPERNMEQGQCWGLLIEDSGDKTYFCYSFVHDGSEIKHDITEKAVAKTPGPKKEKNVAKKGRAAGSAPKVFVVKARVKKEQVPVAELKKARLRDAIAGFLNRQRLFIEATRLIFRPDMATNYGYAM